MIWALHGAFGDADDWAGLGESLRPHHLRAVDLWDDKYDLPLSSWAEAFNGHVSETDPSPTLLGYSMGARLALHALIANPQLWKGAILVAPHPGLSSEDARRARHERDSGWVERFDELSWSDFWKEWTSQSVLATHEERALPPDRRARRRGLNSWSLSQQDDLRSRLDRITCPVLWVTGQRDEKFTAIGAAAVPLLKQGKQIIIPDAGHRVPWDTPRVFAELVRGFDAATAGCLNP